MKLTFFPYDFTYRVEEDKTYVYLFAKTPLNEKICVRHACEPYFYADPKHKEKIKELILVTKNETAKVTRIENVTKDLLGKEQPFFKIYANYPKAVPLLAKEIESWGTTCYERDILFTHRYLRDHELLPFVETSATGELEEHPLRPLRVPLYTLSAISQKKDTTTAWKILAVDIETYAVRREINPEKNPILMIALYGTNEQGKIFEKVITWKKLKHSFSYLEIVESEKAMLEEFKKIVLEYNPDIITGYFSDGFDLPYIKTRADQFNITLDFGLDYSSLETGRGLKDREGESKIAGILHLDLLKFIKYIFGKNLKTESYKLDAVAHEIIGSRKQEVNLEELAPAWDKESSKLLPFIEYNLHDARLTHTLCAKLLYDMIEFSKIIGVPTYDAIRMRFSRLVESYILKRAVSQNILAPNKPTSEETEERMDDAVEGAFVFEPTPGIYKNIAVFDFRSLYPSIITAHNISPESLHCKCCKNKAHVPGREEFWFCQEKNAFLPSILQDIIKKRIALKKKIKETSDKNEKPVLEAHSYALKILANSFYGYLGFYGARWYCIECADSTTAYARYYIKDTIEKAKKVGFSTIYADTDSCFLLLEDKTAKDALAFKEKINKQLPGQMELEYEGYYTAGIFVAIKGSEKGAKKKYALRREDGTLKIVGFEAVRRNWTLLAKNVQQEILRLVLEDKNDQALNYIKIKVKELQAGKTPQSELILKTQITRDVAKYQAEGPHVAVAKRLIQQGYPVPAGTLIEYIITKGPGMIRDRARLPQETKKGEYDPEYYLNHQLIPAVSSIFAVLGYSEDELFQKTSQTGLGKFF